MFKNLNLPNKLSVLRIVLVPVFIILMIVYSYSVEWALYVALGVYIIASITDFVDGKIARDKNLVTRFGKLVDPLADKLLVSAGFIMLSGIGVIPAYITAIVVFRDLVVDTLRMFAEGKNATISAHLSGKVKTFCTMPAAILAMIDILVNGTKGGFLGFTSGAINEFFPLVVNVFMTVVLIGVIASTIWSLIDYTVKAKEYIKE